MNPFVHKYAYTQGRLRPTGWTPVDGEYVYVLGDEDLASYTLKFDDYIYIRQELDLTDINYLRVNSRIVQPTMPVARNVAQNGSGVYTATLQRGHIIESLDLRTNAFATMVHPGSETELREPYNILADSVLRIEVDGGGDVDIQFPSSPPVLTLTAADVVGIINNALTVAGSAALAQVGADTTDPTVVVTADGVGNTATFEVKEYPGPEADANARLGFFKKTAEALATDTKIYGGDDLSAIIAPDGAFTQDDVGQPLVVSGATTAVSNNVMNHIAAVLSPTRAVLRIGIEDEPAGFDAFIRSCLWELSVHVDDEEIVAKRVRSGRVVDTDDIGANVSKLSGLHEVLFRLQLRPVV